MFKRYRKASQSPIPSWATNQQVLIIFFCAFRNKGEGAPAISDLVQRENNGTGYWIVNMSDSHFGRPQYVIYCSQLRATPSADCNISHIAVGLSNYLIHSIAVQLTASYWISIVMLSNYLSFAFRHQITRWCRTHLNPSVTLWLTKGTRLFTNY